mmetsp:Transcript_7355/g.20672  ORF Transcript_7355/g.20672 Transcript_7355/m.20672 type:complete len:249 (-) Transcript_7355:3-749(-)
MHPSLGVDPSLQFHDAARLLLLDHLEDGRDEGKVDGVDREAYDGDVPHHEGHRVREARAEEHEHDGRDEEGEPELLDVVAAAALEDGVEQVADVEDDAQRPVGEVEEAARRGQAEVDEEAVEGGQEPRGARHPGRDVAEREVVAGAGVGPHVRRRPVVVGRVPDQDQRLHPERHEAPVEADDRQQDVAGLVPAMVERLGGDAQQEALHEQDGQRPVVEVALYHVAGHPARRPPAGDQHPRWPPEPKMA